MFAVNYRLATYGSHDGHTHRPRHIVRCQYEIEKAPSQPPPPPPPPPPRETFNMVCVHIVGKRPCRIAETCIRDFELHAESEYPHASCQSRADLARGICCITRCRYLSCHTTYLMPHCVQRLILSDWLTTWYVYSQGDRRALLISLGGIGLGVAAASKLLPQSSPSSSRGRRTSGKDDPWRVLCPPICNTFQTSHKSLRVHDHARCREHGATDFT